MQNYQHFLQVALDLELAGLLWSPEVGDEVSRKDEASIVSVLVDPQGMSPAQLRATYLWLPSVEQMVQQVESRQAILFHVGLELSSSSMFYKTVIQASSGPIESKGDSLRTAVGLALRDLLLASNPEAIN